MLVTSFIILAIVVVSLIIIRIWLNTLEKNLNASNELVEWLKELGKRVETSSQSVDTKLAQNMQIFNNRLDNAAAVISQVHKSVGEFSEIGRSMQELQQLINSPKLRGNIGENILKDILAQHFPPASYSLQHSFKNGDRVDAIIKTSQGLIPIDAKFPMDNYRKMFEVNSTDDQAKYKKLFEQDVKKHIVDIARKYILVAEGTVDYALIYIPSEAVYYEIVCNQNILEYAGEKRILPVSPISFYAYMKSILMSFEGQKIESQAKEILQTLKSMQKDYEKIDEAVMLLNKHVTNAYNQTNNVTKTLGALGQKISSTQLFSQDTQQKLTPD